MTSTCSTGPGGGSFHPQTQIPLFHRVFNLYIRADVHRVWSPPYHGDKTGVDRWSNHSISSLEIPQISGNSGINMCTYNYISS